MPSSACKKSADRKSTRLNSSHTIISYAVFCLKKTRHPRAAVPPPITPPAGAHRPPPPGRRGGVACLPDGGGGAGRVRLADAEYRDFFLSLGQPRSGTPPPYQTILR